jgi:hypothetical protein
VSKFPPDFDFAGTQNIRNPLNTKTIPYFSSGLVSALQL